MFRYRTSATPESTDGTKEHSGDNEHENETVEQYLYQIHSRTLAKLVFRSNKYQIHTRT